MTLMTLIDRYIFRVVISTALVVLLLLLVLEMFFTLLTESRHVGQGNYGISQILQYTLLTLPRRAYETFPMALLLGGLLGMGMLASGSELIAMRAAGLSLLRLVWATLKAGLVLGLVALLLGEFVAPVTEKVAQELRFSARYENVAIRGGRGFWARDGEYFINVRAVLPGVRLADIYIYEVDERSDLKSVTRAESAYYADDHWVLEGVSHSALYPDRVITERVARITRESVINPGMLDVLAADPENLAMRDLLTYIDYLNSNGLDAREYQLAFWSKAIAPLANLTMLFIAMPFVFGSQRTIGVGQRLMVGVFLGLLFYLANQLLGNLVLLYGYPPLLGASLPALLFLAGGTYALKRMR